LPNLRSAELPSGLRNIAAWGKRSSNGSTKYEIVLWDSGHISCDCPGWTFKRKDNLDKFGHERWCKHVAELFGEAQQMYAQFLGRSGRKWDAPQQNDDDEPDVIPRVKARREKPIEAAPISLRPGRSFEV